MANRVGVSKTKTKDGYVYTNILDGSKEYAGPDGVVTKRDPRGNGDKKR